MKQIKNNKSKITSYKLFVFSYIEPRFIYADFTPAFAAFSKSETAFEKF